MMVEYKTPPHEPDTKILYDGLQTTMFVVGWDVGVRDLGCCVLKVLDDPLDPQNPRGHNFKVLEWRVFDLNRYRETARGRRARFMPRTIADAVRCVWEFMRCESGVIKVAIAGEKSDPNVDETVHHVIELQFGSHRMVGVSYALQCCLYSAGWPDVHFLKSSDRFLVQSQYATNAQDSIYACVSADVGPKVRSKKLTRWLLNRTQQPEWENVMDAAPSNKKDDYTDSLLLGVAWANANF